MTGSRGIKTTCFTSAELLKMAKEYYPSKPDLMKDLSIGAVWEYRVKGPTLHDDEKIVFHLRKSDERNLELKEGPAPETPDLILYFTEEAIGDLISRSPDAKSYYAKYAKIMKEGSGTRDVDYQISKSWLSLSKCGYKNWAERYGFADQLKG